MPNMSPGQEAFSVLVLRLAALEVLSLPTKVVSIVPALIGEEEERQLPLDSPKRWCKVWLAELDWRGVVNQSSEVSCPYDEVTRRIVHLGLGLEPVCLLRYSVGPNHFGWVVVDPSTLQPLPHCGREQHQTYQGCV
ncbi:MAG: hypothetical protein US42_C0003G0013 [Candidatus Magasanikbacteria bacterium GW2011_GWC2_37_14]|uniref:Uncharacterized protein n=1 Tax=Candidatus Magasanikbacteria bacterium GW2011_GWC2_37_14 TaxID=1619046 RepID=A0A0G0JIQ3_9BACT|nr:MAG: hypothetical protein US42_C0003G0013 [Candidatus Magasanikbacteria bacterium GW2011_GWC2_37_14]